jgi:hypothetical protein
MGDVDPMCRCGHVRDWHEHYHDRTYCGTCGPELCPSYRKPPNHLAQAAVQRINRLLAIIRSR